MLIYTIGHSTQTIDDFLQLLKMHYIDCVCDVRSMPYSRFADQFNRENLKRVLSENNIRYMFFGEEFGARRIEPELLTHGVVDFEKVALDEKFLKGVQRIKDGIKKGYTLALMCTEKEPIDCHRTILVSRNIELSGIKVLHILPNGKTVEHTVIEEELVRKYFPNKAQVTLFDAETPIDYLSEAYRRANREIGYRKGNEE